MKREQKIVAIGAASGIVAMLTGLVLLSPVMPCLADTAGSGDRLAFAAKWIALAVLPLFLSVAAVGNARFRSDAIDPTAGNEHRSMIIDGRVADNSAQQYLMFGAAAFAVAASASGSELGIVAAAALIFLTARFAFWIGYRIDPLYRAFGMAATSYLVLALLLVAGWMAWR